MNPGAKLDGVDRTSNLCRQYFPHDLKASAIFCTQMGNAPILRTHTFKDDVTTHPKYQAKYKQQSKALERMVTKSRFSPIFLLAVWMLEFDDV